MAPSRGLGALTGEEKPEPQSSTVARSATPTGADGNALPTLNISDEGPSPRRYPSSRPPPPSSRESSVRIRRLSASSPGPAQQPMQNASNQTGRRRSGSEPQRPHPTLQIPGMEISRQRTAGSAMMPPLSEEKTIDNADLVPPTDSRQPPDSTVDDPPLAEPVRTRTRVGRATRAAFGRQRSSLPPGAFNANREYGSNAVDLLDVIDPEVSTLSTLTNVQNSLFIPNLGRFVNRRPSFDLTPVRSDDTESDTSSEVGRLPAIDSVPTATTEQALDEGTEADLSSADPSSQQRRYSISSQLEESHYAVLPHLFTVEEWPEEDVRRLNDHVRHQLHSRRAKFKRSMRGFKKYVSRPLGFLVTLYATLITIFGLVWVLFIIGWLSAGERQPYITNIVDNVLVALFAIVGDGLAPFRVVDTYHMCYIAHYHRLTWRLRREKALNPLPDENDLPSALPRDDGQAAEKDDFDRDMEDATVFNANERPELSILKPEQQRKLERHQNKFSKSHSFYKPHETTTHHAFPLRMLIAAVVLLDCHSIFQIMLGSFTWGWSYHTRPSWITAVILSLSITVNITAGIVISIGDKMTRKKDVIEKMFRQALTEEGIRKLRKKKRREEAEERKGKVEGVKFNREHKHAHHHHERPRFSLDAIRHGSEDRPRMSLDTARQRSYASD